MAPELSHLIALLGGVVVGLIGGMYMAATVSSDRPVDARTLPDVANAQDMATYTKKYMRIECNHCHAEMELLGETCKRCERGSGRYVEPAHNYREMMEGR